MKTSFLIATSWILALSIFSKNVAMQGVVVRASEGTLRKVATRIVMPSYPQESIKRRAKGVAVAQIETNQEGDVSKVEILEAPDSMISTSVTEAVRQWKFRSSKIKDGPSVSVKGKLTFYFVIDDRGKARVENPKQH